ncbi:nicotinate phosphoribosyltransferase [Photobacterium kishitanii]|uniref:Nicotinate phosphoribosyltransferase n=1 Tax=Photobacterium kishitanii TaxID=318456 RepID=A0A2T3KLE0_9GAMM|nr:nicotinate phosphoribosyltransferase [Photobacterium kishitanii]PSV00535.1 nicotinate phosphoribosyltransferase [Photobacterium kishitanii]
MNKNKIIATLSDTDAYKIHMQAAVFRSYPEAEVTHKLDIRSDECLADLEGEIRAEINELRKASFSDDMITHLKTHSPFLPSAFVDYLRGFRFDPQRDIQVYLKDDEKFGKQLAITVKGPWLRTILYEIPILSIVSEVRNRNRFPDVKIEDFRKTLFKKVEKLKLDIKTRGITNFKFAEMGTRRRFSKEFQHYAIQYLSANLSEQLVGTSNYEFAREFGLTAVGTVAHEWFMFFQSETTPDKSQKMALDVWNETFRGELGIGLTDTISSDSFLKIFDPMFAKSFDGLRHDSGSPFAWGDKFISHYESLGIDPMTKTLIFTDSLDFDKCLDICEYFAGRINISFGIGTAISADIEDIPGYKPLSIVMKMTSANGHPVAKVSDEPAKAMCEDEVYLRYLKSRFEIK